MRIFDFRIWRWFGKKPNSSMRALKVVIYKRKDCHLCETASQLIRKFQHAYRLDIEEIDLDTDPALAQQMGDRVPVVYIQGRERFFGQPNEFMLRRTLTAERRLLDEN